jgi:hypothetical protein
LVPNTNLGKNTPVKTEATQSGKEYRNNQDITAPPDPVAPDNTSHVPIHGEKTNTPLVSYSLNSLTLIRPYRFNERPFNESE